MRLPSFYSALATVSQYKVMPAIRAYEVAADPTNALALEAAARRSGPADRGIVRLAGRQRVLRAQRFPAGWSAYFGLFAMVTAGRDQGDCRFERAAPAGHLRFAVAGLQAAGVQAQVALTPLPEAGERIVAEVAVALTGLSAEVIMDRDRATGCGYYRDACFKVNALVSGQEAVEIGDGGCTDWTARLLVSRKERLLISGYGLDRLAMLIGEEETRG